MQVGKAISLHQFDFFIRGAPIGRADQLDRIGVGRGDVREQGMRPAIYRTGQIIKTGKAAFFWDVNEDKFAAIL